MVSLEFSRYEPVIPGQGYAPLRCYCQPASSPCAACRDWREPREPATYAVCRVESKQPPNEKWRPLARKHAAIVAALQAGLRPGRIAQDLGISPRGLKLYLAKRGFWTPHPPQPRRTVPPRYAARYEAGEPAHVLAAELGMPRSTFSAHMARLGAQRSTTRRGGRH